jgi:hypothetical protein
MNCGGDTNLLWSSACIPWPSPVTGHTTHCSYCYVSALKVMGHTLPRSACGHPNTTPWAYHFRKGPSLLICRCPCAIPLWFILAQCHVALRDRLRPIGVAASKFFKSASGKATWVNFPTPLHLGSFDFYALTSFVREIKLQLSQHQWRWWA